MPTSVDAEEVAVPAAPARSLGLIGHDDGAPAGVRSPVGDATASGWDPAAYARDPAAYCAVVAADRAWQIAQPGADVPFLSPVGGTSLAGGTGAIIRLGARTRPGMPVSWTSSGLGEFSGSGLPAITVQADADGVATADFRVIRGTQGAVLITAGSPVCGSTLSYLITIPTDHLEH